MNFGKTNTRIINLKIISVVEYILPFFSERFENEQIGYFSEKIRIKIKKGYLDILEDYILVFGSGKSIWLIKTRKSRIWL